MNSLQFQLDLTYWIIAWSFMGAAFVTAFLAIALGAHALDQAGAENEAPEDSHPTT